MSDLERQLRDLFRDKLAQAPTAKQLSEYLGGEPVRPSRRWQWVAVPAAVLVAAAVVVGVTALSGQHGRGTPVVAGSPSASAMANQHGPVPTAGAASCVVDYSPHAVAERAFAFDGTVTAIGPDTTNRPGRGHLDLASVTFAVNEWFRGGSTETATVDMTSPTIEISGESRQTYGIGTRLLVAGEPRGGDVDPMADAIAWDTCNFTRYWDEETADVWRAASVQWKDALTRAACWARVTGIPDYIAGGPTAPANESSPIELAARTVEALRLADDFPDVSVVVGTDYDVSQVIWIVSDDHIIGELNYAHGDSGWYITEMSYC